MISSVLHEQPPVVVSDLLQHLLCTNRLVHAATPRIVVASMNHFIKAPYRMRWAAIRALWVRELHVAHFEEMRCHRHEKRERGKYAQ